MSQIFQPGRLQSTSNAARMSFWNVSSRGSSIAQWNEMVGLRSFLLRTSVYCWRKHRKDKVALESLETIWIQQSACVEFSKFCQDLRIYNTETWQRHQHWKSATAISASSGQLTIYFGGNKLGLKLSLATRKVQSRWTWLFCFLLAWISQGEASFYRRQE